MYGQDVTLDGYQIDLGDPDWVRTVGTSQSKDTAFWTTPVATRVLEQIVTLSAMENKNDQQSHTRLQAGQTLQKFRSKHDA
jgi:hypothetical protein